MSHFVLPYTNALMHVISFIPAMAEAHGMQRTFSDRLIKSTALLAARSKKITQALSAVGFGLYNDFQKYKHCKKRAGSQKCATPSGIVDQVRKNIMILCYTFPACFKNSCVFYFFMNNIKWTIKW